MILLLCRLSVDYLTCPLVEFVSSLWVCCYMFFLLWLRYFLFIYLFFFFAWCTREKKKPVGHFKVDHKWIGSFPLHPNPTQPPPPPPPSIHPCFTRGTQVLSLCFKKEKWASSVFFFCHSWQFFLRIQFFSKSLRLSLSFSLSCGVVLIYGSRSAQLKHLLVVRLIKVDRLDSTHGAAALMEGHNSE